LGLIELVTVAVLSSGCDCVSEYTKDRINGLKALTLPGHFRKFFSGVLTNPPPYDIIKKNERGNNNETQ
jgi:hypothetical protein